MAAHANDAVLSPITFVSWEILREFTYEDNFNNTFALHREVASQRYKSFLDFYNYL